MLVAWGQSETQQQVTDIHRYQALCDGPLPAFLVFSRVTLWAPYILATLHSSHCLKGCQGVFFHRIF